VKVEHTKDVYALLSTATMGVPALKRFAYKASKSLTKMHRQKLNITLKRLPEGGLFLLPS
jgi:hypothetical protein